MSNADMAKASSKRTVRLQRLGALLIVVLITVAILLLRDRLAQYERYGYLGVFITTLLGSATVVLPVPGMPERITTMLIQLLRICAIPDASP